MAIIGIDLGTTNSLVCVFRGGKPELIPNKFGSYLTPSAVSVLEDGTVLVGEPAKERLTTHPESTAVSFKKNMGSEKKYTLGSRQLLPEELSSLVLSSLMKDAENYLQEEISEAVISVPAYFHDKQRAATKRAGKLAGLNVKRILNEPSAAALAAYCDQNDARRFLVFDFGGGTLDVSVVDCINTVVEILAVAGDNRLGGDDFDALIADQFLKEHGLEKDRITAQEYAVLVKKAEQCKRQLSYEETATLQSSIDGRMYSSTYTMKRLMEESKDLLQKIRKVVTAALRDSKCKSSQIQEIIMAGGSSKMPLIQSYIRHLFHKQPVIRTDCDELIALGLGIFCGVRENSSDLDNYLLMDICPFSLGTNVKNAADPSKPFMNIIIPRNNVLPCSRESEFVTTTDMQKQMYFQVLQGENLYAKDNLLLEEMRIDVTPLPAGQEKARVRFTYDINGILMIDITIASTGKTYQKVLSEKISEEELKKRCQELEKLKHSPEELSENRLILDKLEALYVETIPSNKETVLSLITGFTEALRSQSPARIQKSKSVIMKLIPQMEAGDPLDDILPADNSWEDPWGELGDDESFFSDLGMEEDSEEKKDNTDWFRFYHFDKYTS
ncbi:MAG: Hsp70 family protein [Candidatus Choladocola sp.]|nr:Hsp70 family protein [Candidatus Choladocola sp.]